MKLLEVFSVMFAFASAALLYQDLGGRVGSTKAKMGEVVQAHGTVKQLADGEMIWNRSLPGHQLSENDLITTMSGASATLRLNGGGEIFLEENTTLQLVEKEKGFEVQILSPSGRIRLDETLAKKSKVKRVVQSDEKYGQKNKKAVFEELNVQEIVISPEQAEQVKKLFESRAPVAKAIKSEKDIRNLASVMDQKEIDDSQFLPPEPELLVPTVERVNDVATVGLMWRSPASALQNNNLEFEVYLRPVEAGLDGRENNEGGWRYSSQRIFKTRAQKFAVANLKPGRYAWTVRAVDGAKRKSPMPMARSFVVEAPELRQDSFQFLPTEVE